MQLEAKKLLFDLREAAAKIATFVKERTFEDYESDAMLRSAVERQFEILGEALNRLSKLAPEIVAQIEDYRRIISFRNVLIHGYDVIVDEVVWGVISEHLPPLAKAVEALLGS